MLCKLASFPGKACSAVGVGEDWSISRSVATCADQCNLWLQGAVTPPRIAVVRERKGMFSYSCYPSCHRLVITSSNACRIKHRYLSYWVDDFHVFQPTVVTRCTDGVKFSSRKDIYHNKTGIRWTFLLYSCEQLSLEIYGFQSVLHISWHQVEIPSLQDTFALREKIFNVHLQNCEMNICKIGETAVYNSNRSTSQHGLDILYISQCSQSLWWNSDEVVRNIQISIIVTFMYTEIQNIPVLVTQLCSDRITILGGSVLWGTWFLWRRTFLVGQFCAVFTVWKTILLYMQVKVWSLAFVLTVICMLLFFYHKHMPSRIALYQQYRELQVVIVRSLSHI